jgi:hypothetical protein
MPDPNAVYDRRRCRICGQPWLGGIDDEGKMRRGHPLDSDCNRHRPADPEMVYRPVLLPGFTVVDPAIRYADMDTYMEDDDVA